MPAQLSKLHVRFIQTQKSFFIQRDENSKNEKLPLEHLYIKNNSNFYFANQSSDVQDGSDTTLSFKEANDYLKTLHCSVHAMVIEKGSDEYEEALLFFHEDESAIKQVLLLTIETIDDK
ncbi:MAG: hypothetical protein WBF77_03285 [Sulfurimonadaceae bacterium]